MKKLSDKEKVNWLRVIRSENIGPVTFNTLLKNFGSIEKIIEIVPELSLRGGKNKPIKISSQSEAEKELENTRKVGGDIIALCEDEYPKLLKSISDAPPVISCLGNKELLQKQKISIVGTRHASINGINFTKKVAKDLSDNDYTVVSGLALGIDAAAHMSALNGKASTIAVLGCGVDVVYPLENRKIYEGVKEKGLILSEFPLSTSPQKQNFPRRNRIISGLSMGVLVIEATLKSGSLITSKYALEQGREVFAVPGFPLDPRCEGPNSLIKQGAVMVRGGFDIINEFNSLFKIESLIKEENEEEFQYNNVSFDEKEVDETRDVKNQHKWY